MGYKTIRRVIKVPCPDCLGTGFEVGVDGRQKCRGECKGKKEVERVINEIVYDDVINEIVYDDEDVKG